MLLLFFSLIAPSSPASADVVYITGDPRMASRVVYFVDSPSRANCFVNITTEPKRADKWVYVSDNPGYYPLYSQLQSPRAMALISSALSNREQWLPALPAA